VNEFVEDDSEGPHVSLRAIVVADESFWGHVKRGSYAEV
jgi:hypothetical protein